MQPNNCCFRAFSTARYSFQTRTWFLCAWSKAAIYGLVEPLGMTNVCPGFTGGTTGTPARVLYTVGVTVKARRPKASSLSSECTDAAFKFSLIWISAIDSYVGIPIMGVIIGYGNPSTILSMSYILIVYFWGLALWSVLMTVNTTLFDNNYW